MVERQSEQPRPRAGAQFSLRIEKASRERLASIAAKRGISFSEAAREAIRVYVAADGNVIAEDVAQRIVRGVVEGLASREV